LSLKRNTLSQVEPRKVPVQKRSRVRFERILEVALKLIVERGVDTVPMSDIATGAEISVASLYQYFPEKAAIVATLADRFNQEGQDCVKTCFMKVREPEDLLLAFQDMIDGYYEFFRTVPGSYELWQATQSDSRLQQLDLQDMELHVETIRNGLESALPHLSSTEALGLARVLVGTVATTVRSASILGDNEAQQMIEICKGKILRPSLQDLLRPGKL
jgi:AcrR family transcriptional regulator